MSNLFGLLRNQRVKDYFAISTRNLAHYVIENGIIRRVNANDGGILEWAKNFETGRRIAHDVIKTGENQKEISTIFLGMDHGWSNDRPLLFETMIFGFPNEMQWRYSTLSAAVLSHYFLIQCLQEGVEPFAPPLREEVERETNT